MLSVIETEKHKIHEMCDFKYYFDLKTFLEKKEVVAGTELTIREYIIEGDYWDDDYKTVEKKRTVTLLLVGGELTTFFLGGRIYFYPILDGEEIYLVPETKLDLEGYELFEKPHSCVVGDM